MKLKVVVPAVPLAAPPASVAEAAVLSSPGERALQAKVFKLLSPETAIGVELTSAWQLVPEASTSGLISTFCRLKLNPICRPML